MTTIDQDDNEVTCKRCGSSNIEDISDDERIYGAGLYINGFIGAIDKITNENEYRCLDCNNEF